jgi:multidrug efflux system membrane fusion protein
MKQFVMAGSVVLIALAAGCAKPAAMGAFKMPPPLVKVTEASSADVPVYLDEIGTCTARQYVSITPRVTGAITRILFQDGALVHTGDPLFIIDERPYKAALDQALAQQQQSRAALELDNLELGRMNTLLPTKSVAQDDYDKAKNAADVAQAQLLASDAAVETAKLNLEYCSIVAPVDGRAGQRLVDIGNVVQANQGSLLVVQTLDPIYADFTIAEAELPAVREHEAQGTLKAYAKLPGDSGDGMSGDLTYIDTQVQDQAGRVKMRATLPNPDRHLWPGQFIDVRLILAVQKDAVLVPVAAEQTGQNGPFVYVVKDDKAELRPVTLGQRQGDLVVVQKGVSAGENVITVGQMTVMPGGAVNIVKPTPAAAGPPTTAPSPAAFSPSPGTPGEGRGEGLRLWLTTSAIRTVSPHPNPLPEYQERGSDAAYDGEDMS